MKRSRAEVDARRKEIFSTIRKTGDIRVPDLAAHLGVSEITIRRDLQFLEDHKMIERYYGGAREKSGEPQHPPMTEAEQCKEAVAVYASQQIEDNDIVFVNTSSTALRAVEYITARNVTVISNNGNLVGAHIPHGVQVLLTGGELRNIKGTMVGEFATHALQMVSANKALIGCSGLTPANGVTTRFLNEVDINATMIARTTGTAYILADHTKLGRDSSFTSCGIESVTNVITDALADESVTELLEKNGITVHRA